MERDTILLAGLEKSMLGLEIGAGFKPLASKAAGWNVQVVDHATRDALRAKYQSHPNIDIEQIEEVDIVWSNKALHDCVKTEFYNKFDYCIASHLIEHIPDLLTFFQSIERLLKKNGVLSIAVPDKRFCFDAFKPISTAADVIQAHTQRHLASRHSAKTVFENIAYNVTRGEDRCWVQAPIDNLEIFSPLAEAQNVFDSVIDDPTAPYSDCHAWYFTPSSFQLLIPELRALGRTKLGIDKLTPSSGAEFCVRMRLEPQADGLSPRPSESQRLALMLAILAEQAQQYSLVSETLRQKLIRQLPDGHPFPNLNTQNERLDKILNSHSWRLMSAFWTAVDRVKRTFR